MVPQTYTGRLQSVDDWIVKPMLFRYGRRKGLSFVQLYVTVMDMCISAYNAPYDSSVVYNGDITRGYGAVLFQMFSKDNAYHF